MKTCPICQVEVDDNAVKCPTCGYDFPAENIEEPVTTVEAPAPEYNQQAYNSYNNAPQGKYCPRCGNLCDPKAVICVKCGMSFGPMPQAGGEDVASTGLKVLCVLFPIVALILYIVEKDKKPNAAKEYGKFGIIGIAISVGFYILSYIVSFISSLFFFNEFGDSFDYYYRMIVNYISMR